MTHAEKSSHERPSGECPQMLNLADKNKMTDRTASINIRKTKGSHALKMKEKYGKEPTNKRFLRDRN